MVDDLPITYKIRKSYTGCIYQINHHLWKCSFYPRLPNGKRVNHNVYAEMRADVEVKLAELIEQVMEEIQRKNRK